MTEFYTWNFVDYVRAFHTGYAEFKCAGRKQFRRNFPECPNCKARIGVLEWKLPAIIVLTTDKIGDLCTDGQDILLSDRFIISWEERGLKGLAFENIGLTIKNARISTPPFHLARIPYTITRLDEIESGVVPLKIIGCSQCRVMSRRKVARIRLERESIPDLDVFRPSGLYGSTIVSSRFVSFVREMGFENFEFTHQNDYREQAGISGE